MNSLIYIDNASTCINMDPEALSSMVSVIKYNYGNPSNIHSIGRKSKEILEESRYDIAKCINAKEEQILFTSGGTESNNWVIRKFINLDKPNCNHLVTSKFEHPSVLNTFEYMKSHNYKIDLIDVNNDGFICISDLENKIKINTGLASVMYVNNEIGTIQDIKKISKICKDNKILIHTDAVQAVGHIDVDVVSLDVDFLSASAHKFNGPKGVGFLFCKDKNTINPMIFGGHQENNLRAGTEDIAKIKAMSVALKNSCKRIKEKNEYIKKIRDYLYEQIILNISGVKLNGCMDNRICNNLNLSFEGINGESLVLCLSNENICVSSGSACNSGNSIGSYVLKSIGNSDLDSVNSIRFTLSEYNTLKEMDYVVVYLKKYVEMLRGFN